MDDDQMLMIVLSVIIWIIIIKLNQLDNGWKCLYCNKIFNTKRMLHRHLKEEHNHFKIK